MPAWSPISEDVGAELRRLIGGAPVPAGAIQAATDVAAALGPGISRRVLALSALGVLAGGCASPTEQEARRFIPAGRQGSLHSTAEPLGGGYQLPSPLRAKYKPLDCGYEADFEAHNHHREARSLRDPGSLVITTIVRLERAQRDRAALRDGRPASPCDSSGNGLT